MGLFGDSLKKSKRDNVSCLDLTRAMFPTDTKLIAEINSYLFARKKQKNMPKKKAWECQLKLLEKLPKEQRASQVHRATERGWMAIAFDNENTYVNRNIDASVKREKSKVEDILDIEF